MPAAGPALVHVANLAGAGPARLAPLYRFLDAAAERVAARLARRYARATWLRGAAATGDALVAALAEASRAPGVTGVDLVLHVHGQDRRLVLAGGEAGTAELAARLRAAGAAPRLRLLYSTACFGASHAPDFLAAGFRAAVGAGRVNANGGTEVPLFLALWARGATVARAVAVADHRLTRRLSDAIARRVLRAAGGCEDVESAKVILGDPGVTIASVV